MRDRKPDPYADYAHDDWWHPEVLPQDDDLAPEQSILSPEQVDRFCRDGFIVATGLWPRDAIEDAAAQAQDLHTHESVRLSRRRGGFSEMPWTQAGADAPEQPLNHMTIHPRALRVVAQLMDCSQKSVRLSQSHVIAKFGFMKDDGDIAGDQDIHVDYGNNSLLVPAHTAKPDAVACLCYYSDVDECGGATHFSVAQPDELTTYHPERFNPPNFVIGSDNGSAIGQSGPRSPDNVARMYREEKPVYYKLGTCILYRLNAWHRGTPVALDQVRHTHHHVWRHENAEWINWQSLTPRMAAMPGRYLESLSVDQRTVLGFAAPGNSYWTEETLDSVGQRYPGMDMTPYRNG